MAPKTIRKKVIDYINHAEDNVVEAVYNMLKIYEDGGGESRMSPVQKSEIEKRAKLFKEGKLNASSWEEVKKRVRTDICF